VLGGSRFGGWNLERGDPPLCGSGASTLVLDRFIHLQNLFQNPVQNLIKFGTSNIQAKISIQQD
jgi:hypothetical protein